MSATQNDRFLDRKAVKDETTLSGSQLDRLEKAGKFPKRIFISERRVAWLASEVSAWIQARIVANRGAVAAPA